MNDKLKERFEHIHAYNFIDRSGEVHNYWTIVSLFDKPKGSKWRYVCRCNCGTERIKAVKDILNGRSISCGCFSAKNHTTHNMSNSKVYNSWQNIKNRCLNPNSDKWGYYGGRGITMCIDWQNSFEAFYKCVGNPPTNKH